jgi:hypothetical protein
MKWLDKYRRKVLNKQKMKAVRNIRLCSLENADKVGILWVEKDDKAYKYLYDYFKSRNVLVRYLCYTENKEIRDSNMITPRDINWLGFPKVEGYHKFISTEFDLLLNISVRPNFALDVITALSAASLKVGWDRENIGLYDISIDLSEQTDALYLAEQQIFFLQQLNKNN